MVNDLLLVVLQFLIQSFCKKYFESYFLSLVDDSFLVIFMLLNQFFRDNFENDFLSLVDDSLLVVYIFDAGMYSGMAQRSCTCQK